MKFQSIAAPVAIAALVSSSLVTAAPAPATPDYRVDRSFGQETLKGRMVNLAIDEKDQLYVLQQDGSVAMFDSAGKATGQFASGLSPAPSAIAVKGGQIYLLVTETKVGEREIRGRKVKTTESIGVKCVVFDPAGTQKQELALPEVVSAKDAHFIGDQLAVADLRKAQIVTFDISGAKAKAVKTVGGSFRLCCGIFDFHPAADGKSLLVANLGAFKVQTFTGGTKSHEFGARGEKFEEFHGCCNPVNVADIGGDFIVTVEKSPTRVKICDRNGKGTKSIEGLGELVNGCSTIPIAVDSQGAFYLASATRNCIVKCVTGAAPAAPEAAAPAAARTETRTWHSSDGRAVEGRLVAFPPTASETAPVLVRDGKVCLEAKGRTFNLPLDRLSQEDQDYVARLRTESAAAATASAP